MKRFLALVWLAFAAGEASLLLCIVLAPQSYDLSARFHPISDFVQPVSLVAGLAMLVYTFARILHRYLQSPSDVRLVVLAALLALIATFALKLAMLWTRFKENLLNLYFFNMTTLFGALAVFFMVVFGFTVLIKPGVKGSASAWSTATVAFFMGTYGVYVLRTAIDIMTDRGLDSFLPVLMQLLLYAFLAYSTTLLVVMTARSLSLSRKATEAHVKRGMLSFTAAFALFIGSVVCLLVSELMSYVSVLETTAVVLAVVAFYFVYEGFVKPASRARPAPP
ncbi:MAG: hypothetical protein JW839_19000 [Candidatus Lokiarchaeota archaeon]|nr:hypothetical protein [Candidatus Lokiarchaeota archaeon]